VAETKAQARERLHQRTLELQKDHELLERIGRLFNKAEHRRHREALHKHQQDLVAYRNLPDELVQCAKCGHAGPVAVALPVDQFLYLRCPECGTVWPLEERRREPRNDSTEN